MIYHFVVIQVSADQCVLSKVKIHLQRLIYLHFMIVRIMCIRVNECMHVCTCACVHVFMCTCMCVHMGVGVNVHTCGGVLCACVHVYVCALHACVQAGNHN